MITRPVRIYFSEIKPGDALKQRAESNITPSGGGARDERFPVGFAQYLQQMFPDATTRQDVTVGTVYWQLPNGGTDQTAIMLFSRPTNSRPTEARLGRVHVVGGWEIGDDYNVNDSGIHSGWYYFLVQDDSQRVWAFVTNDTQLQDEPAWIRDFVNERVAGTPGYEKARGFIDRVNNRFYP